MIRNFSFSIRKFIDGCSFSKVCLDFATILIGAIDVISAPCMAIITSLIIKNRDLKTIFSQIICLFILYFGVKFLNFSLIKKWELETYHFRMNEISQIAEKILHSDYEKLQDEEEQMRIAGAYYAVLSGNSAGVEYELNEIMRSCITLLALFIVLIPGMVIFPKESMIALLCNVFLLFLMNQKFKKDSDFANDINEKKTEAQNVLKQVVDNSNALDVYLFNIHEWILNRYLKRKEIQYNAERKQYSNSFIYMLLNIIVNAILFSFSLMSVLKAECVQEIFSYAYLLICITNLCHSLYNHAGNLSRNNNLIEQWRIYNNKEEKDTISSKYQELNIQTIQFKNIGYTTQNGAIILQKINLTINAGEKVALVGKNGAGKTTLSKILLGVIKPTQGEIYVNGKQMSYEEYGMLVSQFGYMPQENSILAFDVATNIVLKHYKRECCRDDVYKALHHVGMDETVAKLQNFENTYVGTEIDNEGVDFSGGEKRKFLIARSLFHRKRINIFDEPTSNLDNKSENVFYQEIICGEHAPMSIFISHRIGTTNFCDTVYVLDQGEIVQQGTGEQLLNCEGLYQELFKSQIMKGNYNERVV